jgi:glycosyltransferase involved in cell wall biosynthesis
MIKYKITIVIGTYNSAEYLEETLLAAEKQNAYKIIACDNESTDDSRSILMAHKIPVVLLRHLPERRDNIKSMRYLLTRMVETEYVFYLDSDVILPDFALEKALEFLKNQNDSVAGVGIQYTPANHVQQGALLVKTDLVRDFHYTLNHPELCSCDDLKNFLAEKNLSLLYVPDLASVHNKPSMVQAPKKAQKKAVKAPKK